MSGNTDLGFLFADVSRVMRRAFDERARSIGVTRPQWRVLTTIARHEGSNQGMLAELVDVEPITLCRMVDRLQDAGLVERRSDPNDRRAWLIYLTPKAVPIVTELKKLAGELFSDAVAGVDPARLELVAATLNQIRANVIAASQAAASVPAKAERSPLPKAQKEARHG